MTSSSHIDPYKMTYAGVECSIDTRCTLYLNRQGLVIVDRRITLIFRGLTYFMTDFICLKSSAAQFYTLGSHDLCSKRPLNLILLSQGNLSEITFSAIAAKCDISSYPYHHPFTPKTIDGLWTTAGRGGGRRVSLRLLILLGDSPDKHMSIIRWQLASALQSPNGASLNSYLPLGTEYAGFSLSPSTNGIDQYVDAASNVL